MKFEFDPKKSAANAVKHGIDFVAAQELWEDVNRLVEPARSDAEKRQRMIAQTGGKLWAAIFTERGDNIRIISVRRARDNEKAEYEQSEEQNDG
jgi:uncharacterized DUF497 family protein